jgi:hypothetical protein
MPVTYPLTLPTSPTSRSITIRKRSAVALASSPFTYQLQSYTWGGQIWMADVSLPPMTRAQAEPWIAVLSSLNGSEGSFLLGDTANLAPRGTATGTPLVKGASQTGYDLVTDGWTNGVTGILKAGDWIQLGTGSTARLYKVMADANSNGSGEATLTLWPKLRSSPADNAAITISSPMGRFMLADDIDWTIDAQKLYSLSFQAIEDLRP